MSNSLNQKEELESNLQNLGMAYVSEVVRTIKNHTSGGEEENSRNKIIEAVRFANKFGSGIKEKEEKEFLTDFDETINIAAKKEELLAQREKYEASAEASESEENFERQIQNFQNEQKILESALESTNKIKDFADDQNGEIEWMQNQLAAVKAKLEEVKKKSYKKEPGYLYVMSNVGSFGDDVYLVGFTNRLEPLDVVRGLGEGAVPFSFDVSMVIFNQDAKGLERNIHKQLNDCRVNKENVKKGFFKTEITEISKIIAEFQQQNSDSSTQKVVAEEVVETTKIVEAEEEQDNIDECTVARSNPFDKVA